MPCLDSCGCHASKGTLFTGCIPLATYVLLLCSLNLVYSWTLLAALPVSALLWRSRRIYADQAPERHGNPWLLLFLIPFAIFGAVYFLHALAPENSPDGVIYHVALISRFFENHGFRGMP